MASWDLWMASGLSASVRHQGLVVGVEGVYSLAAELVLLPGIDLGRGHVEHLLGYRPAMVSDHEISSSGEAVNAVRSCDIVTWAFL